MFPLLGVSSMEGKASGRVGGVFMAYIIITNLIGVVVGLIFALSIHPGTNLETEPFNRTAKVDTSYTDLFTDFIR